MLTNTIRALRRFFSGFMQDRFKARRPVEVSLPADTAAVLDGLKARYSLEITLPAEPFSVWLEHGQ